MGLSLRVVWKLMGMAGYFIVVVLDHESYAICLLLLYLPSSVGCCSGGMIYW